MGHVLNYTMGDVVTHFRRRNGKHVLRPMGWDSFGLPAENAAINEGGHPREIIERNIDNIERQMHRLGWAIDWDREISAHDPAYYRWTQWLFLRFFEHGPRLPQGGAGQLVPERPDGARERAGRRRPLRALRHRGRGPEAGAVVLPDHGLRRRAAARPRADRLAGADEDDPAQLDRPLRGRRDALPGRRARRRRAGLHDAARHALRRDVLRARARAPARRRAGRALAERRGAGEYVAHAMVKRVEERAAAEEKTGVFTGLYADEPGDRRADPGLGRRLRADGLRHRRDHGRARARRARPRVRRALTSCRSCR